MMRLMAESPITAMGNAMDLVGYAHCWWCLVSFQWWDLTSFPNIQPPEKAAYVTAGYS